MNKNASRLMIVLLIIGIAGFVFLGYKSYSAEKFCWDKGHDGGTYKANGGEYYSCRDYTKYYIGKKDGEN